MTALQEWCRRNLYICSTYSSCRWIISCAPLGILNDDDDERGKISIHKVLRLNGVLDSIYCDEWLRNVWVVFTLLLCSFNIECIQSLEMIFNLKLLNFHIHLTCTYIMSWMNDAARRRIIFNIKPAFCFPFVLHLGSLQRYWITPSFYCSSCGWKLYVVLLLVFFHLRAMALFVTVVIKWHVPPPPNNQTLHE